MKKLSTLKNTLDKKFSIYIRMREADEEGYVKCCTCDKVKHWKEMDCGHFQSRRFLIIRWDYRNAAAQCKGCNGFGAGEQVKFARYIDKKWGKNTSAGLERMRNHPHNIDRIWLEEEIKKYEGR